MSSTPVDSRSVVEAIARRHEEPDWFLEKRRRALQAYLDGPVPDRVHHLWRYTDPQDLLPGEEAFGLPAGPPAAGGFPPTLEALFTRGEVSGAVFVDESGRARIRLSKSLEQTGVRVLDMHQALHDAPELLKEHLGSLVRPVVTKEGFGKLEALNFALWSGGTVISVPKNVVVEKPIHVWVESPGAAAGVDSYFATRLLILVGEGSDVTVVDECEGGGGGVRYNSAVELHAARGSRARHVAVQRLDGSVAYHASQRSSAARDTQLLTAVASLGSRITKSDFGTFLDGPGAHVELFGFLFGEGKQRFDHHTVHHHRSGRTHSNLDFKVVLKDRSRSAYTGLIRIEPGCPESEAYQENRNLLLNDGAKAESIPELEILTDEVKCTHGATMGTLDPQHIFYLTSRCIDRPEAIRLIVGGFIEPTLSRLAEDLRDRLRGHVETRIKDL
ncbi:MAG TPA: SufD family Fe-S cluster assembly protein [Planctomycetota bacterium]|nr:SufD family Fe-S cluster assembly protein [Planctomycetota bacterium]